MKMLSLAKWAQKVEQLVAKYGVESAYISAELNYRHHSHIPARYGYSIYIASVVTPTIYGDDWKLVLKEAELILRKKGYKKQAAAAVATDSTGI